MITDNRTNGRTKTAEGSRTLTRILPLSRFAADKAKQLADWTSAAAAEISRKLGYRAGETTVVKQAG